MITWGELKKAVEAEGVTDNFDIEYINVQVDPENPEIPDIEVDAESWVSTDGKRYRNIFRVILTY